MFIQVPQGRNVATDRGMLDDCFRGHSMRRLRVSADDPEYKKKIESRHVLDRKSNEFKHFLNEFWSYEKGNNRYFRGMESFF